MRSLMMLCSLAVLLAVGCNDASVDVPVTETSAEATGEGAACELCDGDCSCSKEGSECCGKCGGEKKDECCGECGGAAASADGEEAQCCGKDGKCCKEGEEHAHDHDHDHDHAEETAEAGAES